MASGLVVSDVLPAGMLGMVCEDAKLHPVQVVVCASLT